MNKKTLSLVVCSLLVACQSASPEPLVPADIVHEIAERSIDPEVMELALSFIERPSLALPIQVDYLKDADRADFWQASAFLYAPEVRAARRDLEAALGRLGSAGQPGPIGLSGRFLDIEDFERDRELSGSVDLLGLLGLGPAAAAEALAKAEVRTLQSRLEEAVWRTRYQVDSARLACARQLALVQALTQHRAAVASTMARIEALNHRGRLPAAAVARTRAHAHLLSQELTRAEADLEDRRAELAQLAGLVPEHARLHALSPQTLRNLEAAYPQPAALDRLAVLEQHPELRRLQLDYAVAEASLRRAVAEGWPSIRIGPRAKITPDDFLTGGLIDVSLPWPGSTNGNVEAALARRARARERVEEAYVAVVNREAAARRNLERRQHSLWQDAEPALAAATTTFQGMSARMQVNETAWEPWTDALALKTNAIREFWRLRHDELQSRIVLARELAVTEKKQ